MIQQGGQVVLTHPIGYAPAVPSLPVLIVAEGQVQVFAVWLIAVRVTFQIIRPMAYRVHTNIEVRFVNFINRKQLIVPAEHPVCSKSEFDVLRLRRRRL